MLLRARSSTAYLVRTATAAVVATISASTVCGQTLLTWGNAGADWNAAANWLPSGVPGSLNTAQFIATGGATVHPVLNGASVIRTLSFGSALGSGWTLSGGGSLVTGLNGGFDPNPPNDPLGYVGIHTWAGSGDHTISLGNGSSTSLNIGGFATGSAGAIVVAANSRLTFSGNTVATIDQSLINGAISVPQIAIRGGTFVLDNSAGNPTGERLSTGSSNFNMVGGGSALELRGAAVGTVFGGLSRSVTLSAGSCYVRTVQTGGGTLAANFSTISRATGRHLLFIENVGTGFAGDAGKPSITSASAGSNFNVTQSFAGIISASTTTGSPWVMVTNRASDSPSAVVTGRWANYNGGIVASTPSLYTGDFSGAPSHQNVLYAPGASGTVSLGSTPSALASVVLEPTTSGAILDLGANSLNTRGIALSGGNDMTVANGNLFYSDGSTGARVLNVLNPASSLYVSSNLAESSNSSIQIGGRGFVVFSGTSNQVAYSGAQSFFLNDGVLRVSTTSFVPTNTAINFRGGTLEYDVSGAPAAVTFALGSAGGNVNWSSTSAGSAGEKGNTDTGGGGFSAYSTTAGNTLTVNLGGTGAQVDWNAPAFVTSFTALKFGSLKSNATVDFQNPIGLGTLTNAAYRTRNIDVTRGAGNPADKTILSGVISGVAGYDLVKTGTGVLETTAANTYAGNTIIRGGEYRVSGANTGTGSYFVQSTAQLSGTGAIPGAVDVQAGGSVRGDSLSGSGSLTVGAVTVHAGGKISASIGASGIASRLSAGIVNLLSGAVLDLRSLTGFGRTAGSWNVATLANGSNLLLNGSSVADNFVFGSYVQGTGAGGAVPIDTSNFGFALSAGDQFQLARIGNNLVLNFSVVTEPSQWAVDSSGNWSTAGNWSGAVPDAPGAAATFGSVISAPRTVTVDSPRTVGQITFNSAIKYTIAGSSAVILDSAAGSVGVKVESGSHDITAPVSLSRNTTLDVTAAGGVLSLTNLQPTTADITKIGAGNVVVNRVRAGNVVVSAGRFGVVASGTPGAAGGTSIVKSLTIASGAQFDVANNALVVDYTSLGSLLSDVRTDIAANRLVSTTATIGHAIGFADNAVLGLGSFGGQTVDATSLLARYTRLGDANLDGTVNLDDFTSLAAGFGLSGTWRTGDFTYDGLVNLDDFTHLASNFGLSISADLARGASVPEPGAAGLLAVAAAVWRGSRRARRHR